MAKKTEKIERIQEIYSNRLAAIIQDAATEGMTNFELIGMLESAKTALLLYLAKH